MITEFPPNTLIICEKKYACEKKYLTDGVNLMLKIKPIIYNNYGTVKIVNNNVVYEINKDILYEIHFSSSTEGFVKILLNGSEIYKHEIAKINTIEKIKTPIIENNKQNIKLIFNDCHQTEINVQLI